MINWYSPDTTKLKINKRIIFIIFNVFLSLNLSAQLPGSWTMNDGCVGYSGPCTTTGITETPAGTYVLTEDGSKITTSMWNNTVFSLENPFTLQFEMNFGNHVESETPPVGGEGIALGMQAVWAATGGTTTHTTTPAPAQLTSGGFGGGDLGMKCLQSGGAGAFPNNSSPNARSIVVEFDVFDNTSGAGCTAGCNHAGDLPQDHIGINYEDCSATSSNSTLGPAVPALTSGASITDGVWRPVEVRWVPDPPIVLGTKYDRYVDADDCLQPGSFVDQCGNTVLWSSTTCNANRNCNIMAVNSGTMVVSYNGVVRQNVVISNLDALLNNGDGINGRNIRRDFIFGFTASTEGKTNYQAIRNPIVLPVKYAYFNVAKASDNSVKINWATFDEKNSAYFLIQRSSGGGNWETIKKIDAAGNSSDVIQYSHTDQGISFGLYYYRLLQVDMDGSANYSSIEVIDLGSSVPLIEVYPNPVTKGENIKLESSKENITIELLDVNGKQMLHYSRITETEFNISTSSLNPGVYFIKVMSNQGNTVIKKVVIL